MSRKLHARDDATRYWAMRRARRPALRFAPRKEIQKGPMTWSAPAANGDYIIAERQRLTGRLLDTIYTVRQGDRSIGEAATLKAAKALAQADT